MSFKKPALGRMVPIRSPEREAAGLTQQVGRAARGAVRSQTKRGGSAHRVLRAVGIVVGLVFLIGAALGIAGG
ncbi:MAG: hypothetical protein AAGG56_05325 [Pseudomonadota bacterium]